MVECAVVDEVGNPVLVMVTECLRACMSSGFDQRGQSAPREETPSSRRALSLAFSGQ